MEDWSVGMFASVVVMDSISGALLGVTSFFFLVRGTGLGGGAAAGLVGLVGGSSTCSANRINHITEVINVNIDHEGFEFRLRIPISVCKHFYKGIS